MCLRHSVRPHACAPPRVKARALLRVALIVHAPLVPAVRPSTHMGTPLVAKHVRVIACATTTIFAAAPSLHIQLCGSVY